MKYVLYNPLSDNSSGADNARELLVKYPSDKYVFLDITSLSDEQIFELLEKDDGDVILSGGDGTLNRFANTVSGRVTDKPIYYYPKKLKLRANWDFEEMFDHLARPQIQSKPKALRQKSNKRN